MFEDVKEYTDPEREKNEYHFFYNREERLKNAPQIVRDYYDGKLKPLRGFSALYKNKANLFVLLALVFFVGVAWIYTGFNKSRNYAKISDIDAELSAFSYNDEVYVSARFKRNVNAKDFSEKDIKINFEAVNADLQVAERSEDFLTYKEGEQFLRTKFPDFDIIRIDAAVEIGGEQKELSTPVKR